MRFHLRTLLILLAVGPMAGAWGYWQVERYLERQRRTEAWIDVTGPGSVKAFSTHCTFPEEDDQTVAPLP